ncbi:MAG: hypothetical protein ACOYJG_04830 [Prevotella sp.]|jgi:hypothetical protein
MKHLLVVIFLTMSVSAHAQTIGLGPLHSPDSPRENWLLPGDTVKTATDTIIYGGKPQELSYETPTPGSDFGLHEGLNANVSASAFATFGHDAPHKGGFATSLDVAYLKPLNRNKNLWLLGGGYINSVNYGGDNLHDGCFFAMLDWQINQHWNVYAYGQLSIVNNYDRAFGGYYPYGAYSPYYSYMGYSPYPFYGGYFSTFAPKSYLHTPGANVLGAGVEYRPNPNVSVSFNVEGVWYDNHTPSYFDRYNYPVPRD